MGLIGADIMRKPLAFPNAVRRGVQATRGIGGVNDTNSFKTAEQLFILGRDGWASFWVEVDSIS
jgi:hypothetical protein